MPMDYPQESLSVDTPLLPEVIIDGQKVAPGSTETLAEIYDLINLANLAKIRKRLDDQAALGKIYPYNLNITFPGTEILFYKDTGYRGMALSLINDGPAPVQIGLNKSNPPLTPVNVNQPYNVNLGNHTLEWFYLTCGAGLTAAVRIIVKV